MESDILAAQEGIIRSELLKVCIAMCCLMMVVLRMQVQTDSG